MGKRAKREQRNAEPRIPQIGDRVWAFSEVSGDYVEAEIVGVAPDTGTARVRVVVFGSLVGEAIELRYDQLAPYSGPMPIDPIIAAGPPDLVASQRDPDAKPIRRLLFDKPKWKRRHGVHWHLEWMERRESDGGLALMILELTSPDRESEAYRLMQAVTAANWAGQMELSNPHLPYIEVVY